MENLSENMADLSKTVFVVHQMRSVKYAYKLKHKHTKVKCMALYFCLKIKLIFILIFRLSLEIGYNGTKAVFEISALAVNNLHP